MIINKITNISNSLNDMIKITPTNNIQFIIRIKKICYLVYKKDR